LKLELKGQKETPGVKPGVDEQKIGLKRGSPRQLQRDFLFQLVRQIKIAGAPFCAGLHGDLGDLGIHDFDAHPDVALFRLAMQ
jgi:hypothetical protein